jgi:micrococcal nuclease
LKQYSLRLYGIDSPEMKPLKSQKNRLVEKEYAKTSKKALSALILNKIVIIDFEKKEKYGRLMGTIFLLQNNNPNMKWVNVNKWMVQEKYAIKYDGNKKISFSQRNFKKKFTGIVPSESYMENWMTSIVPGSHFLQNDSDSENSSDQ